MARSSRRFCCPSHVSLIHDLSDVLLGWVQVLLRRRHALVSEHIHHQFEIAGAIQEISSEAVPS
jgi:hypothetical protein